jgi:hypothetical protein
VGRGSSATVPAYQAGDLNFKLQYLPKKKQQKQLTFLLFKYKFYGSSAYHKWK